MDPVETPADIITADVMGKCATPIRDDHDEKFGVPSLEELGKAPEFAHDNIRLSVVNGRFFGYAGCAPGFETEGLSTAVWPGGETEALTRLERHLERKVNM